MTFAAYLGNGRRAGIGKSRFSEEQIIGILKEGEAGTNIGELCRGYRIGRGSYYRWRAKHGGLEASAAWRLRQPENENRRLKHPARPTANLETTWKTARRVVAKVEHHAGELFPRAGFIVTNTSLPSRAVVRFYNRRGTAEVAAAKIKEGK